MRTIATTIAAAVAAAALTTVPAAAQQDQASIAMPALTMTFTPVYVALDAGYWREAGLDVKLQDISGLGSTNAMLAGSVDFAVHSGPTLIRGNIRGQKMMGLALMASGIAFEITMRPQATGGLTMAAPLAERAQALKGKKVGVDSPNSIVHAFLRFVARKGGVDPEREITVVSMQPQAMLAALRSGDLDAGTHVFPWTRTSQRQGDVLMASGISDAPDLLPFMGTTTSTKPDFCDKKPSVCEKLVAGYLKAHALIHEDPKAVVEILKKRMPAIHPDDLESSFVLLQKTTPRRPVFDERGFQHAQELMVIGGMIKPEDKLSDFSALYTNKYIR